MFVLGISKLVVFVMLFYLPVTESFHTYSASVVVAERGYVPLHQVVFGRCRWCISEKKWAS
jgi:hypothetical protein